MADLQHGAAAFGLVAVGFIALMAAFVFSRLLARSGILLDRPNSRSSHTVLTPRAGGVALFAAWLVALAVAVLTVMPAQASEAMQLSALMIGVFLFGLADDVYDLRPILKLVGQFIAASAFVILFAPDVSWPEPLSAINAVIPATVIAALWIVAFVNAFNFMDGVNGIAASCGAIALCAIALVSMDNAVWMSSALIGALALFGFLAVNLEGRLFLGDNGSQAMGFLIAIAAVQAAGGGDGAPTLLLLPTIMAPFVFDVGFTLGHRLMRRRPVLKAHREHVYQLLVRSGRSHVQVAALYAGVTALTTGAALIAMRLGSPAIWMAPAVIALLLAFPAVVVFRRAARAGHLETQMDDFSLTEAVDEEAAQPAE
jgi:UDP-N-acetylmuramyl pentapeptide phosphotransferase/UDP-N-acetylglucosamine-1-phosphate transferase